ncbi:hypothetical protein HMPREF1212_01231 [Parabacteroides sp. HGS0025]|nr:hypothetical protein HMPREF1212_01231 [Parabacteroides sp. HGS0025]
MNSKYKIEQIVFFIRINKKVLIGMLTGAIIAYLYWLNYSIYWGTYPLSSECWVNCIYGFLFGGLIGSLFQDNEIKAASETIN